jgi:hypothetical protein
MIYAGVVTPVVLSLTKTTDDTADAGCFFKAKHRPKWNHQPRARWCALQFTDFLISTVSPCQIPEKPMMNKRKISKSRVVLAFQGSSKIT